MIKSNETLCRCSAIFLKKFSNLKGITQCFVIYIIKNDVYHLTKSIQRFSNTVLKIFGLSSHFRTNKNMVDGQTLKSLKHVYNY